MDKFRQYVNYNATGIHNIFVSPVNRVFYWKEKDYYEGKVFIVYELNGVYIYQSNKWGCCDACDKFSWVYSGNKFSDINRELFDAFPEIESDTDSESEFDYKKELEKVINHELLRFKIAESLEQVVIEKFHGGYQYQDLVEKWTEFNLNLKGSLY